MIVFAWQTLNEPPELITQQATAVLASFEGLSWLAHEERLIAFAAANAGMVGSGGCCLPSPVVCLQLPNKPVIGPSNCCVRCQVVITEPCT